MNPYATLVGFILSHAPAESVLSFRASEEMHDYVYTLLEKEKDNTATREEIEFVEQIMTVEYIMRLAKSEQYTQQWCTILQNYFRSGRL